MVPLRLPVPTAKISLDSALKGGKIPLAAGLPWLAPESTEFAVLIIEGKKGGRSSFIARGGQSAYLLHF